MAGPTLARLACMDHRGVLDVGVALSRAQEALRAHWRPFVGATALAGLVMLVVMTPVGGVLVLELTDRPLPGTLLLAPAMIASVAAFQVALVGASLWLSALALRALRQERLAARDQLRRALQVLPAALVAGVCADTLMRLGMILCLVPGIVLACSFAFGQLLVLDKGLGPIAALQASRRLALGRRWSVWWLWVISSLLAFAGAALLGVGLLVAVPLAALAWVAAYEQLWPLTGPRQGVVPSRRWAGPPAPPEPGTCARCREPWDPSQACRTCAGCGAVYHSPCATSHCLVPGCPETWPVHADWTREARAGGPWMELPARPVPAGARWVSLLAAVGCLVVSDNDNLSGLIGELRAALPEPWMAVSASLGVVAVPWGVLLLLAWQEHRAHRAVLVDGNGLLLDFGATGPGTRVGWHDMRGFELDGDGVWVRRHGRASAVLLAAEEALRPQLVELLEARKVRRLDA